MNNLLTNKYSKTSDKSDLPESDYYALRSDFVVIQSNALFHAQVGFSLNSDEFLSEVESD